MTKSLKSLLSGLKEIEIDGNDSILLNGVSQDSRNIDSGFLFVAIRGLDFDGHDYIDKALGNGARAVLCEEWPEMRTRGVVWVKCHNTRSALAHIAMRWYDRAVESLEVVGITGTNGKTTVSVLLFSLFKELGYKVGLISTIEIRIGEDKRPASLTTPDPLSLHALFREMADAGCSHVFMEVSSHALDQDRVTGIPFRLALFTNISHDHLDYHGDFKAYIAAKKKLFDYLGPESVALINADDKNASVMCQNTRAEVVRYSLQKLADYKARILESDHVGLFLDINGIKIMTRLIGRFNAYNLLAVFAVADLLKVDDRERIAEVLSGLKPVKGRVDVVSLMPKVIIDYAHTPDALQKVLEALRAMSPGSKLITVIGCGGNRDKAKRPVMGRVAVDKSDQVILTSDNPRYEKPSGILQDMQKLLSTQEKKALLVIEDRRLAIQMALKLAGEKDVVLIAGKGHEEYQEIEGTKRFFSDEQVVKDILSEDI